MHCISDAVILHVANKKISFNILKSLSDDPVLWPLLRGFKCIFESGRSYQIVLTYFKPLPVQMLLGIFY